MPRPTKRELEEQNRQLRDMLEEVYDRVGEILGIDTPDDAGEFEGE